MYRLTLAALVIPVAPAICQEAPAEHSDLSSYFQQEIEIASEIASILDMVGPDTVDDCIARLEAMKDKVRSIKSQRAQFSEEEKKAFLKERKDIVSQLLDVHNRVVRLCTKLDSDTPGATPEQIERLKEVFCELLR